MHNVQTACAHKLTTIIERFGRTGVHGNERIPFMSAMSMLGAADNEQHSYLDIVYAYGPAKYLALLVTTQDYICKKPRIMTTIPRMI